MTAEYTLKQKAIVEFLGTFSIVFFGTGAVAIELMTVPEELLAGGEAAEFTIGGLGLGALGWLGIAVAFWGVVSIPIYRRSRSSASGLDPEAVHVIGPTVGAIGAAYFYDLVVLEPAETPEPPEPSADRSGEKAVD